MKKFTFLHTIWLVLAAALLPGRLLAQSYLLPAAGTATYTTCGGTVYDDGGPTYPYDSNANGSITLLPATAGAKLKLAFSYCEVDSVNTGLYIYDGPDTRSPLIGRFYAGRPTVYATGSTGALTLAITSYGLPRRGFAATISCETTPPPAPDLAVLSLKLPLALVPAGESQYAAARVYNLAGGLTSFRLRYLLSADATPDAGDVELGRTESSLAAGDGGSYGQQLTVPATTLPGRYYVLAVVQLLSAGAEVSTANNVAAAQFTVPTLSASPDLALTALGYSGGPGFGISPPLTAGAALNISAYYQNLGRALAPRSAVGYYLSADATLSADDQLLGRTQVEPTGDRGTALYQSVLLPTGLVPGAYYLLGVADYLDQVIEADELNNVFAAPLTLGPPTADLTFARLRSALPNQVGAGGTLTVSAAVQNNGSAPLDSAAVGYYLSADRDLSADDVLLGHLATGYLAPGSSVAGSASRTLPVPAGTPLGPRYLLLVSDYRQEVAETDETNNIAFLALEIVRPSPDLAVTAPRNGSIYEPAAGAIFYTRCSLANQGTTAAYPVTLGYYLSADATLSADDQLLAQSQLGQLAGGASQPLENSFLLPATVAPGTYYLLFVADHLGQLAEANKANNVAALLLRVSKANIDLVLPYSFDVLPTRAAAGSVAKVNFNLNNLGTTPAITPQVGFFLSADTQWSPDDAFIGGYQSRYNSAYPNSATALSTAVSVPGGTAPGRYYVLGVADFQNQFDETDETNNVRAAALEVTAPLPDLQLGESLTLTPQRVAAGSSVAAECYLSNLGATDAGAARLGYYLSADAVLGPDDVLLGSAATSPVPLGNSVLAAGSFVVPAATASGRYYVLFVADYLSQLTESSRANNLSYTILAVTAAPLAAREQLAGAVLVVAPVPVASPAPLRVQLGGLAQPTEATLGLYNSMGQLVATRYLALGPGRPAQAALPTAGLAPGVYVLRLSGPDLTATRRVVVE